VLSLALLRVGALRVVAGQHVLACAVLDFEFEFFVEAVDHFLLDPAQHLIVRRRRHGTPEKWRQHPSIDPDRGIRSHLQTRQ